MCSEKTLPLFPRFLRSEEEDFRFGHRDFFFFFKLYYRYCNLLNSVQRLEAALRRVSTLFIWFKNRRRYFHLEERILHLDRPVGAREQEWDSQGLSEQSQSHRVHLDAAVGKGPPWPLPTDPTPATRVGLGRAECQLVEWVGFLQRSVPLDRLPACLSPP